MASLDSYEKVAGIIGVEMDKAWKGIISKLSEGDVALAQESELIDFFENLGGAHLALTFASRQAKGERLRSTSLVVEPKLAGQVLGSGEISIGGTYRF